MAFTEAQLAAAAGVVDDMVGPIDAAEEAPPSVQPAPAADTPAEPETPAPDDDYEFVIAGPVSDDDLAELGLLDDEEDQPEATAQDDEIELPDDDDYDETAKLRRELAKERKRREHVEQLRAQDNSSRWAKEAQRRFPYANVETITATSKRAFLRAAALSHNANHKTLKPLLEQVAAEKARLKTVATAEARTETAARWGKPTSGPGVAPAIQGEANAQIQEERERARRTGTLTGVFKKMFEAGVDPFG